MELSEPSRLVVNLQVMRDPKYLKQVRNGMLCTQHEEIFSNCYEHNRLKSKFLSWTDLQISEDCGREMENILGTDPNENYDGFQSIFVVV
jgi:hypothetical protein